MLPHQLAARSFTAKQMTSNIGLLTFQNLSKTNLVAMRFLDPRYKSHGIVVANLTAVNFNGWAVKSTYMDKVLMPMTRINGPNQIPAPWTKLEVMMCKGIAPLPLLLLLTVFLLWY
jgi:hypothetical protein